MGEMTGDQRFPTSSDAEAEKAVSRAWEYWVFVVEAAKKAEAASERAQTEAADWWKRELAASDAYDRAVAWANQRKASAHKSQTREFRARIPGRDPLGRFPR